METKNINELMPLKNKENIFIKLLNKIKLIFFKAKNIDNAVKW